MKKIYNSIKFTLFIALVTVTQSGFAQCTISYNQNGENIVTNPSFLWGQGFIAECDGKLEYVQLNFEYHFEILSYLLFSSSGENTS